MNIALFTDTFIPQVNGVANTVFRSAQSLTELGHNVCIYTISKYKSHKLDELTGSKIKVYTLPSASAMVYKGERLAVPLGMSIKHMRKFKPDVIHTHTPFSVGWEAVWCAKKLNVPLVGTHHTFFDHYLKHVYLEYDWARKFSWKYTVGYYNRCDMVVSPTESLAHGLKSNGLKRNVEIVPNPVDIEKYCPAESNVRKSELKDSFGITGKSLVFMGRVSYEKSIDQTIRAIALVAKKIPDIKFVVIGDGPEKENLIRLTEKLGLRKNVLFTGFIYGKNLIEALQASDIFLLSSKSENMPLAVLESMAIGLPIITVSSLGMVEIVKDGGNGFLLSPDDPKEMSEKILELLTDENKLQKFSEKSREMALEYSSIRSAEKLLEIYKGVI